MTNRLALLLLLACGEAPAVHDAGLSACVAGTSSLRKCEAVDGGAPLWRDQPCANCRTQGDSIACG